MIARLAAGMLNARRISISRCWFGIAVALLMGLVGGGLGQEGADARVFAAHWERGSPGPWGNLEKKRITFQIAGERLPAELLDSAVTRWVLPAQSREQLVKLLTDSGISPAEVSTLTRDVSTRISQGGSLVQPSDELVLSLSAVTRAKLYRLLGQSPANQPQHLPYGFRQSELAARFRAAQLSAETKDLLQRLLYMGRRMVLFADLNVLLRRTADPLEQRRLLEFLMQFDSYQVRLVLNDSTDVQSVARYWGNASHFRPYLSALAQSRVEVNIMELLSPFARARLNSYPERNARRPRAGPDCFWTAANYFNETPDDAFFNPEIVTTYIQQDYQKVSIPTYGDVVLFVEDKANTPVHAAIYVADDLMFTKNGYHYWTPWTINSRDDLEDLYGVHGDVSVHYFRKKSTLRTGSTGRGRIVGPQIFPHG